MLAVRVEAANDLSSCSTRDDEDFFGALSLSVTLEISYHLVHGTARVTVQNGGLATRDPRVALVAPGRPAWILPGEPLEGLLDTLVQSSLVMPWMDSWPARGVTASSA